MPIGDQVGKIAVDEVNSTTLPEAAKIITDTLTQVAVITNGLLTGIEGERIIAMQGIKDDILGPLLKESAAWRELLSDGFIGTIGGIPFTLKGATPALLSADKA
jgi:hypothetical protein